MHPLTWSRTCRASDGPRRQAEPTSTLTIFLVVVTLDAYISTVVVAPDLQPAFVGDRT